MRRLGDQRIDLKITMMNVVDELTLDSEQQETLQTVRSVLLNRNGPRGIPEVHPMWRCGVDEDDERDETKAVRIALQRIHDNEKEHYELLVKTVETNRVTKDVEKFMQLCGVLDLIDSYVDEMLR